ncbi:hypothetical protein GDO86_005807 [Hymenochirus boettgeri]|uniref:G-protein coupled receptors family 1 profile domain-containing protein n=1 Tax=Hymenochirus boettgeri TaxID=247094 RepID=A0A8T2JBI3_9PIPI|nr:hypothetical protein GDO86_005807 [Hymenochirus boettgeri]
MTDASNIALNTTFDYFYPDTSQDHKDCTFHFQPVLYCFAFSLGLVGNVAVILVLMLYKRLLTTTDVYLFNLAISDLLFVFSLPFLAYSIKDKWVFGNLMCKILSTIYFVGFYSNIFFITVISIDRYLAIVHVVFALRVRTVKCGFIFSVFVWILAIFISIPNFLFHKVLNDSSCALAYPEEHKQFWKLFSYFKINIFGFISPLSILTFCYLHIIRSLQNCKCKKKKCAIRLIILVVVVFFLFWTPYNIVIFLHIWHTLDFDLGNCRLDEALDITHTLTMVHCCLNPIIYTFAGEKFRMYLCLLINKPLTCLCRSGIFGSYKRSLTHNASSTSRISRGSISSETVL